MKYSTYPTGNVADLKKVKNIKESYLKEIGCADDIVSLDLIEYISLI